MDKRLKKLLKYTGRTLLGILLFIGAYLLAAVVLPLIPVNAIPEKSDDVTIYINSNGVHTDILVPIKNDVKDWSREILYTHTKSRDSIMRYVAFGWGDKGFYLDTPQWSDLKASTAFKAAFYMGTAAMHTKFYNRVKEDEDCIRLTISKQDYQMLVNYIDESFQYDEGRKVLWIKDRSYGDFDAFYEAKRKYSLFYTCNTWANNALKAANQKAALWTPTDSGIFYHYRE
ncbi:MAG: TIGR02117 family protein [Flavobacterium sp.]|nr:MAG: TIGR02117 family protein [Flavobacterium sp.]